MDDLILNVNIDETNQHHNLIVDTFLGNIKTFKNAKYSDKLRKTDVFSLKDEISLSENDFNELITILQQSENRQLAENKHLIHEKNIIFLFSAVKKFAIYYSSRKSGMYRIFNFYDRPVILTIDKANKGKKFESYINYGQMYEVISIDARLINANKQIYLFDHNIVYSVQEIVNSTAVPLNVDFINFIIKKAGNPTQSELKNYKLRQTNKTPTQKLKQIDAPAVHNISPVPVLYLHLEVMGTIAGDLKFRYGAMELDYTSFDEYIIFNNQKMYRDKKVELEYARILLKSQWEKSFKKLFTYQGQSIAEDVDVLLKAGFVVLSEKGTKVLASAAYSYHINYGIDWFELDANIHIDDITYSLAQAIKLRNKNQRWVEIDNHIIMLPKEILEHSNVLTVKNGKMAIPKKNIGDILELAEALSINKIDRIEKIKDFKNIDLGIQPALLSLLRTYQIEGVRWLLYLYQNRFGGCLADDMGLGKTIQVIAFLSDRMISKNGQPSLIIVPKTLLFNWKNELEKFNPELQVEFYHGQARKLNSGQNDSPDIILTTYGTVLHDVDQLSKLSYNCIVIDESQYIKNDKSKTYRAIRLLPSQIKIALTGTPIENNIGELWSLMNLLNPKVWGKKKDFVGKYSAPQKVNLLKAKLSPFVLRRTKKQVLRDLPDKTESVIYCDMDDEQQNLYNALLLQIQQEVDRLPGRFEMKSNAHILRGLLHLRQVCCHPKLLDAQYNVNGCKTSAKFEVLQNIVDNLYGKEEKIVIFSQFTAMLKIIEAWLKRKRYQYFYLDGQTRNREEVISNFEEAANGIMLISLKAGGVGINLTSASYAVIYDPWWNPAVENQAADRLYRIGQNRNVTVYKLITVHTIEEKVNELKKIKLDLSEQVLEGQDSVKNLTIEDWKRLLI